MYLVKTAQGQQAFKERHADLGQRLRSAFLLFDGSRSLAQVLQATAATGVSQEDIESLITRGWLQFKEQNLAAAVDTNAQITPPSLAPSEVDPASGMSRYQKAYPMAVSITGGLGLKGFRLNLAVEAAMGYQQLVELAPRIRDAVGDKAYVPLHKALFEADAQ